MPFPPFSRLAATFPISVLSSAFPVRLSLVSAVWLASNISTLAASVSVEALLR
jgi:hypothetical protein